MLLLIFHSNPKIMKTRKLVLFSLLLMCGTLVFGQDYTFKVLINKGSNELKSGDGWQPIKTGASLKAGDELKLADNAYVGLVHSTGKPIELKLAGNYKVADLAAKVSPNTSVLNKYTDFILSNNSAESKKNKLSATGAVHRGNENYAIRVLLPENQYSGVFNNTIDINWEGSQVQGPFVVTFRNMFEDELAKFETPETSYRVDLSDAKFAKESAILIEVRSKADAKQASKQYMVKRLSPADQENIKKSQSAIVGEVNEQTAINKLFWAGFYEENHLLIDAIAAYEDAIRLAPDVPFYQEAYDDFLLRQNIRR